MIWFIAQAARFASDPFHCEMIFERLAVHQFQTSRGLKEGMNKISAAKTASIFRHETSVVSS